MPKDLVTSVISWKCIVWLRVMRYLDSVEPAKMILPVTSRPGIFGTGRRLANPGDRLSVVGPKP
jgi:hypothetical protein